MKKKYLISIIVFVVVLLLIGIIILLLNNNNTKEEYTTNYVSLGTYQDEVVTTNKIITSYEEYKNYFEDNEEVKEDMFNNNNYVVIDLVYDECSEKNMKIKSYELKDNVLSVNITYDSTCGVCAPQYIYYLIPVDKNVDNVTVEIDAKAINSSTCDHDVAYKPIIYLYPETEQEIELKLGNSNYLTTTYPKYNNGWKVVAKPNGDLTYNNRYYYGLYWEGINHKTEVKEDGFIVEGNKVEEFLEEKLSVLGLTEREADEFIIYWLPKLETNKYNYIRFETKEEIEEYMPININPNPDTLIRVLMDYKALDEPIKVKEQELTTPKRKGFTVVEWGGSIIE